MSKQKKHEKKKNQAASPDRTDHNEILCHFSSTEQMVIKGHYGDVVYRMPHDPVKGQAVEGK